MVFTSLAGLNRINQQIQVVMKQINTGYKVNDALDDGAAFAVAQGLRADIIANEAVRGRIMSSKGTLAVANEAATKISDTITRMKGTLTILADDNLSDDARALYQSQFESQRSEIQNYIDNATFGGVNVLDNTSGFRVMTSVNGNTTNIQTYNLNNDIIGLLNTTPTTAADAQTLLTGNFVTAQQNIGITLSTIGNGSIQISNQADFLGAVSDATEVGLGAIVDADLAKAAARLQSLQIQQQLATITLGMSVRNNDYLLKLFDGINRFRSY
ncbi:MAG TPA: hypothetical protein DIS76_02205 [Rhodospirillaceae bacterium]|nr:hypothetical protein [Rhodospirillaceae bacterium]